MAITRRQFVTRLGTLAAAMGLSQTDFAKISEVFGHASDGVKWWVKPSVVWVHGAECTGCSTSVLGFFEDVRGEAILGSGISTAAALDLMVDPTGLGDGGAILGATANHPMAHRTLAYSGSDNNNTLGGAYIGAVGADFEQQAATNNVADNAYIASFADVAVDFISLEYHETVNGMAGDLAYQWLKDRIEYSGTDAPFVLVVEGAMQHKEEGGAWGNTTTSGGTPWCSIGMNEAGTEEHDMAETVTMLAGRADCIGVVAIGQCATFGGYPACESPNFKDGDTFAFAATDKQTSARGAYDHLAAYYVNAGDKNKVINVPGCPTNPWWFVLSVVAFLLAFESLPASGSADSTLEILTGNKSAFSIKPSAVDSTRRLKSVYGVPLHGPACTRYQDANYGRFATQPGDSGCLQLIGCKGPSTGSLCGVHGWNAQQPTNDTAWEFGLASTQGLKGGNCIAGGHPCMGCTEKGYPDSMVPFVVRR